MGILLLVDVGMSVIAVDEVGVVGLIVESDSSVESHALEVVHEGEGQTP